MSFSRHLIGSLAAAAILAPALVKADAPAAKWYDKVSVGGYAEAYYMQDLNQGAQAGTRSITSASFRAFDKTPNEFVTNSDLSFKYADEASKTGALVEIGVGPQAQIIVNSTRSSAELALQVLQANLTQSFGPLTFTLGKFATPVGYETWNSTANANFSRSLLYTYEPVFHVGAKVDYNAPLGIVASVFGDNGNSVTDQQSNAKNWGAVLAYSGVKNLSLTGVWYEDIAASYSDSGNPTHVAQPTHYGNFIAAYTVSDSLNVAAEYLWMEKFNNPTPTSTNPVNQGYELYATYTIKGISISPRFGQGFAPNNAPTSVSTIDDYTLTVKYPMGPLTHILEYRAIATDYNGFTNSSGPNATASQYDQTLTYAATYSF